MTPYMRLLMSNFVDLLTAFKNERESDPELWTAAIEMLSRNLTGDDGSRWFHPEACSVANVTLLA